ncbi:MAG: hypothetical protein ABFS86_19250 [Planctomycetota bacterium]
MRTTALLLAMLVLSPAALAQSQAEKKQQVLDKIESLIEEGDLDTAGRMIDFFLDKNPGDEDLVRMKEKWRIAKGEVGPLLEEEGLGTPEKRKRLREVCWKIAGASMKGNPDEWEALLGTGEPAKAKGLLGKAAKRGAAEDRRTAETLIGRLDGKSPAPMTVKEIEGVLAGSDAAAQVRALRQIEDGKLSKLRRKAAEVHGSASDPEVRAAAAGALLALGDAKVRPTLLADLKSERPVEAVLAMEVLVRHPGKGKAPLIALFGKIEADEAILRVKPTLLSLAIGGIGDGQEEGALEFLSKKLTEPTHAVDAARALGALGDEKAVDALIAYLKKPPRSAEDDTTGSGLGFLGGQGKGMKDAAAAEELRPRLVGALAILRVTAPAKKAAK